jgi:hypothetical protein
VAEGSLKGKHANAENSLVNSPFAIISVSAPQRLLCMSIDTSIWGWDLTTKMFYRNLGPQGLIQESRKIRYTYIFARHSRLLTAALTCSEVLQEIAYGRGRGAVTLWSHLQKENLNHRDPKLGTELRKD